MLDDLLLATALGDQLGRDGQRLRRGIGVLEAAGIGDQSGQQSGRDVLVDQRLAERLEYADQRLGRGGRGQVDQVHRAEVVVRRMMVDVHDRRLVEQVRMVFEQRADPVEVGRVEHDDQVEVVRAGTDRHVAFVVPAVLGRNHHVELVVARVVLELVDRNLAGVDRDDQIAAPGQVLRDPVESRQEPVHLGDVVAHDRGDVLAELPQHHLGGQQGTQRVAVRTGVRDHQDPIELTDQLGDLLFRT